MNKIKLAVLFSIGLFLAGCSSVSVKTDYDPNIDFSEWKTFGWHTGNVPLDDALSKAPLIKKRLMKAVETNLEKRGLKLADEKDADFLIVLFAGVKEKMHVTNYGGYGWYNPWWGPYGGRTDVSYYEEGTLVIDFVDMPEKELAWRGVGTKIVGSGGGTTEEAQEKAQYIVDQILAEFPPAK